MDWGHLLMGLTALVASIYAGYLKVLEMRHKQKRADHDEFYKMVVEHQKEIGQLKDEHTVCKIELQAANERVRLLEERVARLDGGRADGANPGCR